MGFFIKIQYILLATHGNFGNMRGLVPVFGERGGGVITPMGGERGVWPGERP